VSVHFIQKAKDQLGVRQKSGGTLAFSQTTGMSKAVRDALREIAHAGLIGVYLLLEVCPVAAVHLRAF
jgi:hypothetical protein